MGAALSLEHIPEQIEAVRTAEQAFLEHCEAKPKEKWLDLSPTPELEGLSKIRVLQVGAADNDKTAPLTIFLHGGGGLAVDWAPIMKYLKNSKRRYWFIDRPGHGLSDPFDYLSISDRIDKHAAAYIDAVRKEAGVEKFDIVGNSAGGCMAYYYAKQHPDRINSFTWVGAPALFEDQPLPFVFRILGSWLGTQIMSRPPPSSLPSDLHLKMFNQTKEGVPESYVELYRAVMSCRHSALSWNYLLRALFLHQEYTYPLDTLCNVLTPQMNPNIIVGSAEPMILDEQLKTIQDQFGKPNITIGQGHLPWNDDPEGVARELEKIMA